MKTPKIYSKRFRLEDLKMVAQAPPPNRPPLAVGDRCELNSGSPSFLVTDITENDVTVAWEDADGEGLRVIVERIIPRACVRRADR